MPNVSGDDGYLIRLLASEDAQELLEHDHAADVDKRERKGERAVDERAVDEIVNVPQPVAQDGDADGIVATRWAVE